ncbi:MAG: hypothetical protein K6C36_05500 [Clostridia bacterium]|nr:hypothetical protein [Clostridia bacterium]
MLLRTNEGLDRDGDGFVVPLPVQAIVLFVQIIVAYLGKIWKYLFPEDETAAE